MDFKWKSHELSTRVRMLSFFSHWHCQTSPVNYVLFMMLSFTSLILTVVNGHMKLVYPPPRLDSPNIKTGPCGSQDFSDGDVTTLAPNSVVTLNIYEQVYHEGAPLRVALSHVNNDSYSDCILLNHIPQHTFGTEANALYINITIPDVSCSLCALQVVSVMTDKIGDGNTCEYHVDGGGSQSDGDCWSNYHSCANVMISGSTNREDLVCSQPDDWPYKDLDWNMYTQEESDEYWCEESSSPLELTLITDGSSCDGDTVDNADVAFGMDTKAFRNAVIVMLTGWILRD